MVGYNQRTSISYTGTLISPLISSDFPTERENSAPALCAVITRVERNMAGNELKIPPSSAPPSLPISTAQMISGGANRIQNLTVTSTLTAQESENFENTLRNEFAKRHSFDREDQSAMWISNTLKEFKMFTNLFRGIQIFVSIIGAFTIIAGIVGVSNIMIIVVNERTKEIGIRKAVGATPGSIIGMIILEAVFITGVAGYIGLISGIGLLSGVSKILPANEYFSNPQVDFKIALVATIVLIIAGTLAGLMPSLRASRIRPVEALRDE